MNSPMGFLFRWALLAGLAGGQWFLTGCASYKPIPADYLKPAHSARVVVKHVPDRPQMTDSGQGGIIGAIVTGTSRAQRMREQLAGIQGTNLEERIREVLDRRLGEHLKLSDSSDDLRIEVTVQTWGWFVPTTSFGIKVGEYQSQLIGKVEVFQNAQNKRVAYALVGIQRPIGLKPEENGARTAVAEVAQAFAEQAEEALVHSLKPSSLY